MINGVVKNFNGTHSQRIQKIIKPMIQPLKREFVNSGKKLTPETRDLVETIATFKAYLMKKASRKISPNPVEYVEKTPACILNLFK